MNAAPNVGRGVDGRWERGKEKRSQKVRDCSTDTVTKSYDNFQTITGTGKQPQVISEKIMDNYWFSIAA